MLGWNGGEAAAERLGYSLLESVVPVSPVAYMSVRLLAT